jgi:hypothetical protein
LAPRKFEIFSICHKLANGLCIPTFRKDPRNLSPQEGFRIKWTQKKLVWNVGAKNACFVRAGPHSHHRVARFFWVHTKTGKNIPNNHKNTQCTLSIPNARKIDRMSIKYTNIFHCRTLQKIPKFVLLVRKYTIWQPCSHVNFWSNSKTKFVTTAEKWGQLSI